MTLLSFCQVTLLGIVALIGARLAGRQQDLQGTSLPVQLAVMAPFILVPVLRGDVAAITFMSYFPLSAPVAVPVRLFGGHVAWWEPFAGLLILAATAAATLLLGSRLYEGSLLRTNGRTSWATAWKSRNAFSAGCRKLCP